MIGTGINLMRYWTEAIFFKNVCFLLIGVWVLRVCVRRFRVSSERGFKPYLYGLGAVLCGGLIFLAAMNVLSLITFR